MKKRKKHRVFIYFFIIVFIFILSYFFINDNVKSNFLFNSIKDLTASISNITSISFIKKDYSNDIINELNNDYKKEINDLKQILDLNTLNSNKVFINSTVIKRSTKYWYNIITIDKGEKDGIRNNLSVINNNGLIGKVIKVNKKTSDIKLLISNSNNDYISAMFNYNNDYYYGLIDNYDYIKNELTLKNVIGDFDRENIKNINVVTSGLSDSFASGLLIGKIKDITKDTFGLSNIITITPSVNFNNLDIVTVVVGDK